MSKLRVALKGLWDNRKFKVTWEAMSTEEKEAYLKKARENYLKRIQKENDE
ncbi:hypothetical protein HN682_03315 [Candidatus Peregrinibacteria bacterium]|jgi:hypothetical protein|nr:hypothetical protein [Candidatus Peregrinibacteria bacterium]